MKVVRASLLLILIIFPVPVALAAKPEESTEKQTQILHGAVQDFGIFCGSAENNDGLLVTSVEESSLVYLIKPGKAKTAHLESGDQILSAKLRENELEIAINRKGKRLKAYIILQGDQNYKETFLERLKDAIKQARKHTRSKEQTEKGSAQ